MSMVGKWDGYYSNGVKREYGDSHTYTVAAQWLNGRGLVEDWGCGTCWAKPQFDSYRGVDGSGPFADIRADLETYLSTVPCILLRHVLEHNVRWRSILVNALYSFTDRMALVMFMPCEERERVLYWQDDIPYIFLPKAELEEAIAPYLKSVERYRDETCYLLEKE